MRNNNTLKISLIGMGIALNTIGAFIALSLRLPIYLDTIGTIMVGFTLGPLWGAITGVLASIISGVTSDIYALYFAPVQILVGFFAGWMYKKGWMKGLAKTLLATFGMTIVTSLVGSCIAAYLFGGVTSSGSSYIVVTLMNLGFHPVASVFVVQFFTDYIDKLAACLGILVVLNRMPGDLKAKLGMKRKSEGM